MGTNAGLEEPAALAPNPSRFGAFLLLFMKEAGILVVALSFRRSSSSSVLGLHWSVVRHCSPPSRVNPHTQRI